ncbi:MAG: chorismate mutase [Coriobacteriales bacterium]|jgi:chorismate mutase
MTEDEVSPEDARAQIERHRARIDELDEEIVKLLNERSAESIAIRKLKPACGMELYDPGREERIFERIGTLTQGPMTAADLRRIYETLLVVMKEVKA